MAPNTRYASGVMGSSSRRARLTDVAGRLALAVFSLIVALVGAELALRLLQPASPAPAESDAWRLSFFAYHPRLGWDLVPGAESELVLPETTTTVRINPQGLRSDRVYPRSEKVSGSYRVVALGDSFTFGYGVENDEIYTARMERLLDDGEVINLGVTGYGLDQQLLKLEDQGLDFAPDVVLVGLFEGDVFRNARSSYLGYAKPRFELVDGELKLTNVPVPRAAPAPGWLARTALARLAGVRGYELAEHLGFGEAWPVTEALLARLRATCEAAGCELRVAVIPKDQAVYGRGPRRRLHHHTVARIVAMLERQRIPHLDLIPALAAAGERVYFEHDGHWNAAGHRVAAEALATWLSDPTSLRSGQRGSAAGVARNSADLKQTRFPSSRYRAGLSPMSTVTRRLGDSSTGSSLSERVFERVTRPRAQNAEPPAAARVGPGRPTT